jgi:hypothetical protein
LQGPHVFVVVSQVGVVPEQNARSVEVHCTHAPLPVGGTRHAGKEASGHSWVAPEPLSPLQGTHVLLARLHTGVVPPHEELSRHATHVFVDVLHRGVGAEQFAFEVHGTQVFVETLHAGVGAVHALAVPEHTLQLPLTHAGNKGSGQEGAAPPLSF